MYVPFILNQSEIPSSCDGFPLPAADRAPHRKSWGFSDIVLFTGLLQDPPGIRRWESFPGSDGFNCLHQFIDIDSVNHCSLLQSLALG